MTTTVEWYIEGYIIYTTYTGTFTVEDLRYSQSEIVKLSKARQGNLVHVIADSRQVEKFDIKFFDIREIIQKVDGFGWTLAISTGNPALRVLANMLGTFVAQVLGQRYRTFSNLDDALEFLSEQDELVGALIKEIQR